MTEKTPATKPAKKTTAAKTETFSAEEKAAMKQAAAERRKNAAGQNNEETVLAAIAELDERDRPIAEGLHRLIKRIAPQLTARTWYGYPAYALDAKGKELIFYYQFAAKFKTRYGTLCLTDKAKLDDGAMFPVSYAITAWTPAVEREVEKLITRALG